ncbi:MAG: outer membrane beta-barrel protein [Bacteroidota bacterium]
MEEKVAGKANQLAQIPAPLRYFNDPGNLLKEGAFTTETGSMRALSLRTAALAVCILFISFAYSQTISISGQILSANKKPMASVSVSLLKKIDSSIQRAVVTDETGNFTIDQLRDGDWLLLTDAVGFKKNYSSVITIRQKSIVVPPIILQELAPKELAAVTVVANKSYTEQKIDRTVVNVDALISNTGTNALEVLEKTPGVLVDENGTITFKGKSGVLVLIDDKPTYLSATDLAAYLKSLPSSALDKIELMDNPPAKYDAAGNAGVINIRTKKSKAKGFNGSVALSYGQAFYGRNNESLNLNYYTGKINLFTNIGYSEYNNIRILDVSRSYFTSSGNPVSVFKQQNTFYPKIKGPNYKFGFDYYRSPKTTWGIVFTGSVSDRNEYRPTSSSVYNGSGSLDSSISANNYGRSHFSKAGINLNYTHKFDSLGKTLSFDVDYIKYGSDANQTFANSTYASTGVMKSTQNILAQLPSNISIYAAKTDLSLPMPGKVKFEAGLKSSYVTSDNEANYFNINNGISTVDYDNTNHFIYKENINAGYLNLNKAFKKLTLQAGLRAENTNGNGHQLGNAYKRDSAFSNHYTNIFPTAYFSYKLDSAGNNLLNLSFGRRIDRPNYQDLNPFVFILDKFTYFAGNPFLRPQFSNEYKLSYTHKNKFTVAAFYDHISDVQIETIEQNGTTFISRNGNIGDYYFASVSIEASLHPAKWWTMNIYAELDYNNYRGNLYSGYINSTAKWIYGTANNQFVLGNGWTAELSGFYCGPRSNGQFDKIAFGQVNPAIQKKIWNNKASIKLSGRDIFNTNTSTGNITNVPNVLASYRNRFYNQSFTIGFSYSFGKQLNKEQRKIGSADSEAGRVGN